MVRSGPLLAVVTLALGIAALLALAGGAQAWAGSDSSYSGKDNRGAGGGPLNLWGTYDALLNSAGLAIPNIFDETNSDNIIPLLSPAFDFQFYGTTVTELRVSDNGYVTMSGNQPTDWDCDLSQTPPSPDNPNNVVFAYYNDMDPDSGGLERYMLHTTTNAGRALVLNFKEVPDYDTLSVFVNFTILLFEDSDAIEIHYNGADGFLFDQSCAGIENAGGTIGMNYDNSGPGFNRTTEAVQFRPLAARPTPIADSYAMTHASGTLSVTGTPHARLLANDRQVGSVVPTVVTSPVPTPTVAGFGPWGSLTSFTSTGAFTFQAGATCPNVPTTTVTFPYSIQDAWGTSTSTATVTITVTGCNAPPVANDQSLAGQEDVVLSVPLSGSDPNGDSLWYNLTVPPLYGTLSPIPTGPRATPPTVTYTPAAHTYNKANTRLDQFTYRVEDGRGGADTATFTLDILPVNDAPVLAMAAVSSPEDGAATHAAATYAPTRAAAAAAQALAFDEQNQTLTLSVTGACDGTFFAACPAIASGTLTYTPQPHVVGTRTINVRLTDSGTHEYTGPGAIPPAAPLYVDAALQATVLPVNDPPWFVLAIAKHTSAEDAAVSIPESTWLSALAGGPPGAVDELDQIVTVSVVGPCDTAFFLACPAVGTGNTITYTPRPDLWGSRTITLRATDDGTDDASGTVVRTTETTLILDVLSRNDPPTVLLGAPVTVDEDSNSPGQGPGAHVLSAWASHGVGPADEAAQTIVAVGTSAMNPGLFAVQPRLDQAGTLRFTLAPNAFGASTVTVTVYDSGPNGGGHVNSTTAQFTITVAAVNDPPVAVNDDLDGLGVIVTAGASNVVLPILANDIDVEGSTLTATALVMTTGQGTLSPTAGGVAFTPAPGFAGPVAFDYRARDPGMLDSNVATATLTVRAPATPTALIVGPTTACAGDSLAFRFSALAIGRTAASWSIDLDDGRVLTSSVPGSPLDLAIQYPTGGAFAMNLTADLAADGDPTDIRQAWDEHAITVAPCLPPTAHFTRIVTGLSVAFTDASTDPDGGLVGWSWDFGDGTTGTGPTPTHVYVTPGTYTVQLQVTDDQARTATTQQTFELTVPAGIEFLHGRCAGDAVTMRLTAAAAGRTPKEWRIDGGNGVTVTSMQTTSPLTTSILYATAGTPTVSVEVDLALDADPTNLARAIAQRPVNILPCNPPSASFLVNFQELTATFTDTSTDADDTIVSRAWDFGGGATSTATNPTHTFAAPGPRVVTLTVMDANNRTSQTAPTIDVPVPASLTFLSGRCAGETFIMLAAVTALGRTASGWTLHTGDGRVVSPPGVVPSGVISPGVDLYAVFAVAYPTPGTYTVTATVTLPLHGDPTDVLTGQATRTNALVVRACAAPSPAIQANTVANVATFDGTGSLDPDGSIVSWSWEFGDGATGSGAQVVHAYGHAAIFPVRLTVRDNHNLTASTVHNVAIAPLPVSGAGAASASTTAPPGPPPAHVNGPPTARIGVPPDAIVGRAFRLDGSSSSDPENDPLRFAWMQLSGPPITMRDVQQAVLEVTPPQPGTYRFRLTVTDGRTAHAAEVDWVAVARATAAFTPVPLEQGSYAFRAPAGALAYEWDFGDGATSTEPNAVHAYASPGPYVVSLRVTDGGGVVEETRTVLVEASQAPAPQVTRAPPGGAAEAELAQAKPGNKDTLAIVIASVALGGVAIAGGAFALVRRP